MNDTITAPPKRRFGRLLAGALLALAAATTGTLVTAGPAAAAQSCTPYFRVGDVDAQVCWNWGWIGGTTNNWRPTAWFLHSRDASKRLYIGIATNASNEPEWVYLGAKDGNGSFGVPTSWSWDMRSGVESTTTHVARRLPGRTADCLALVRHDRYNLFVISVTGQCT